ncbi:hypothetical protein [Gloeothece verrucosa]|uniref:Uncharacterized protein n=1 Tax=Gloeothece verrucosa (strain PCC 7822) TaxID=497965 RepID=E0UGF7_GLOV7|nr:hypothetical protein [Gloeothece verrucosa]ADN16776.1 hypothetical protein Cyan7822_4885 [Gloeothece verrucosa PCC 7822]
MKRSKCVFNIPQQCLEEGNIWHYDGDLNEYIAAADLLGLEYDYCETDEEIEFAALHCDEPMKAALCA